MPLEFDAELHRYTLDGKPLPSVTQILEAVGVVDYSYLPPSVREMALARGTAVHVATQFDDEGDLDENSVPDLIGYVKGWRRFRADFKFQPALIEHRSHYRGLYAGTLDRMGSSRIGPNMLVDIKTNSAEGWVALQTAAYAKFFDDPGAYTRIAVELHGDGTYRTITFPPSQFQADFGKFLSCLNVYQLQAQYGRLANRKERAA